MKTFALLTLSLLSGLAGQHQDRAPDGARSVGQTASLKEILHLFRQPTEEDQRFLAELRALEGELLILESTAESVYRARGLYAIFEPRAEPTLAEFHRAALEFIADPEPRLGAGATERAVWARILFDVRLQIRAELFLDWRRDAGDVRKGLALLQANTDGWVRTDEAEAQEIAKRIDLAAALLRARVKDLGALRETPDDPSEVRAEDVERLLQVLQLEAAERAELLDELFLEADRSVRRMRGLLFSSRLRVDAQAWIRWRDEGVAKARRLRAEVRLWQPQTDEGKDAPRQIRIQKKTTRRREAFGRALQGLAYDPFDDELAYAAGLMSEFVSGTLESLDFYDSFLALRGLRVHQDRNWPDELTDEEEHAIFQIQQFEQKARDNPGLDPGTGDG